MYSTRSRRAPSSLLPTLRSSNTLPLPLLFFLLLPRTLRICEWKIPRPLVRPRPSAPPSLVSAKDRNPRPQAKQNRRRRESSCEPETPGSPTREMRVQLECANTVVRQRRHERRERIRVRVPFSTFRLLRFYPPHWQNAC